MQISDQSIELTSEDSHKLDAYVVHPERNKKGNVVIIQEIFGITKHIEDVCRQYANEGYSAIAPALYDRFEKNIILDYKQIEEGKSYKEKLAINDAMKDINAAILFNDGPTAIIGYCFGGMLSHIAASELESICAVSYYGGFIAEKYLEKTPQCPIMYHFGEQDFAIPMTSVELIRQHYPEAIIHSYKEAGHGFNCEMRNDYHKLSANLAFERTLNFLNKHMETN
ncbi:MAG TPA: dienelactone hydrolase family protein [Gammaproteobacteria bacterium]|jgi:carboxymethylenebutenolidase|nr:dienelactone hydrolase family protein [Gammaproteobacteria bacterium]